MNRRISRRAFLRCFGAVAGGTIFSACVPKSISTPSHYTQTPTASDTPKATDTLIATDTPTATYTPFASQIKKVNRGYYFIQQVATYYTSEFGAISTASEATQICDILLDHSVSGVEFGPIYFHPEDISATITVAEVFMQRNIDLWLTSSALMKYIRAFNNDEFPSQYQAYSMTSDGHIVPAFFYIVDMEKVTAFDVMDPEAMSWFLERYKQQYLIPVKPYTSGYFFNEDCLYYANDPGRSNNSRINYWELAAYSDAVLREWQKYCLNHSITYNGQLVTKFPVHLESMVPNGDGKTQYFPGYNVPPVIESGTPLFSIPRNTGIWAAWDDFVTSQYVDTYLGGISKAVSEVNYDNSNFKGVIYFGSHPWALGYEEVTDKTFVVDSIQKWVPWGTQRGVRLSKVCSLPFIDYIICETYPPIRANLYAFISTFKQTSTDHSKTFGVMLHADVNWGLDGKDTEVDRWKAIQYFQPTIIARYPIDRLFPTDQYYSAEKELLFDQRMNTYRH